MISLRPPGKVKNVVAIFGKYLENLGQRNQHNIPHCCWSGFQAPYPKYILTCIFPELPPPPPPPVSSTPAVLTFDKSAVVLVVAAVLW